jgi:hypothetical protein
MAVKLSKEVVAEALLNDLCCKGQLALKRLSPEQWQEFIQLFQQASASSMMGGMAKQQRYSCPASLIECIDSAHVSIAEHA